MQPYQSRRHLLRLAATLVVTAVVMTGLPAPASAAPPTMFGFAYVDDPTVPPWTLLDPAHQATSPATSNVEGGKVGPGRFLVKFPGLGLGAIGNVHVTAVDKRAHYCEIVKWDTNGVDEVVEVACFAPGGVPDDSRFTVLWTFNSAPLAAPGASFASALYDPSVGLNLIYNSTGAGITATPLGTGAVAVKFEKVGAGHSLITGTLQVTAYDPAARPGWCKVAGWDDSNLDMVAIVWCFDAGGKFADNGFTISYQRARPVVAASGPPKYFGYVWSVTPLPPNATETDFNYPAGGFGLNTVVLSGNVITVTFPQLMFVETHVQVTAYGADPNYCHLAKPWIAHGIDLFATAVCFDPSGAPVLGDVFMAAANRK